MFELHIIRMYYTNDVTQPESMTNSLMKSSNYSGWQIFLYLKAEFRRCQPLFLWGQHKYEILPFHEGWRHRKNLEYGRCSLPCRIDRSVAPSVWTPKSRMPNSLIPFEMEKHHNLLFHPVIYFLKIFWKWLLSVCSCLKKPDQKNQAK